MRKNNAFLVQVYQAVHEYETPWMNEPIHKGLLIHAQVVMPSTCNEFNIVTWWLKARIVEEKKHPMLGSSNLNSQSLLGNGSVNTYPRQWMYTWNTKPIGIGVSVVVRQSPPGGEVLTFGSRCVAMSSVLRHRRLNTCYSELQSVWIRATVVTNCKRPINPVSNPNSWYSHLARDNINDYLHVLGHYWISSVGITNTTNMNDERRFALRDYCHETRQKYNVIGITSVS
jgi:hypothetical protein